LNLVEDRDGHWLAIKSEEAKILLSDQDAINLPLERLRSKPVSVPCSLILEQEGLQSAIGHLSRDIAELSPKYCSRRVFAQIRWTRSSLRVGRVACAVCVSKLLRLFERT
jgi:hypothetical protein